MRAIANMYIRDGVETGFGLVSILCQNRTMIQQMRLKPAFAWVLYLLVILGYSLTGQLVYPKSYFLFL